MAMQFVDSLDLLHLLGLEVSWWSGGRWVDAHCWTWLARSSSSIV